MPCSCCLGQDPCRKCSYWGLLVSGENLFLKSIRTNQLVQVVLLLGGGTLPQSLPSPDFFLLTSILEQVKEDFPYLNRQIYFAVQNFCIIGFWKKVEKVLNENNQGVLDIETKYLKYDLG